MDDEVEEVWQEMMAKQKEIEENPKKPKKRMEEMSKVDKGKKNQKLEESKPEKLPEGWMYPLIPTWIKPQPHSRQEQILGNNPDPKNSNITRSVNNTGCDTKIKSPGLKSATPNKRDQVQT